MDRKPKAMRVMSLAPLDTSRPWDIQGGAGYPRDMVNPTLLATVEALSDDERAELAEFIDETFTRDAPVMAADEMAIIDRRDAELDADQSRGYSLDEFEARIRSRFA